MILTDYTISCLRDAGWCQGRSINISSYLTALQGEGYPIAPDIVCFLREFGGLEVVHKHHSGKGTDAFIIDPLLAIKDTYIDRIRSYEIRVGKPLTIIGEAFSRHMVLLASLDMHFFAGYDDILLVLGNNVEECLNNLCNGGDLIEQK